MPKRSTCQTLQLATASSDRVLNRFPQPYHPDATPYLDNNNFHDKVKARCLSERVPQSVGLRVAKAVLIGDPSVGKTSVVTRFCHNIFSRDYKATIGVDFEVERFDVLGTPFNLQIWDTAGQEKFRSIASSYYRNAHVIVVMFDVSNLETLSHCGQWLADALTVCVQSPPPLKFLVANKLDVLSKAEYQQVEHSAVNVARELGAEYWPISAKTGDRISELFFRLTALLFNVMVLSDISQQEQEPANRELVRPVSSINLPTTNDDGRQISKQLKKVKCCK